MSLGKSNIFIGLVVDLIVLKPAHKFFGQFMVVLCYLKAGLYLKEQFFYNYWNIPLSILWMLSIINAFNLVDVMDGPYFLNGAVLLCPSFVQNFYLL